MTQQRPLEGKLAIVTGASRGIGAAICENLASKGCNLLMNYTSPASTKLCVDLAQQLKATYSVDAEPVQSDLADRASGALKIIDAARTHFAHPRSGNFTISIVVHNAGVAKSRMLATSTAAELIADYDHQYAINVLGPLLLMQACVPYLPTDGSGRVVTLSSVSASLGTAGQSVYAGTKGALEAMTRCWARELGGRATVNSINPGPVETEMYASAEDWFVDQMRPWNSVAPRAQVRSGQDDPETIKLVTEGRLGGRSATPAEIAGVVGMLVSAESTWCTGSVICANGGMRMSP